MSKKEMKSNYSATANSCVKGRDTMNTEQFIEEIYEIAFGDDAIHKEYSAEEVVAKIREFSDKALELEE